MWTPSAHLSPIYIPQVACLPSRSKAGDAVRPETIHIDFNMKTARYPESQVDTNFDDFAHSAPPTSTTDFSPYNNSPFSYNTPSREHTPASSIPSPALHDKSPGHYGSIEQPLAHPNATGMGFYSLTGAATTQAMSLIPISNTPVTESNFEMTDYINTSPTLPYFGHYTVSDMCTPVERRDRYQFPLPVMGGMHTGDDHIFSPQTTTNQSPYETPRTQLNSVPAHYSPVYASNSTEPPQNERPKKTRGRVSASRARPAASRRRSMTARAKQPAPPTLPMSPTSHADTVVGGMDTRPALRPTLQLGPDARPEELLLMELRREFSDGKGKGMWGEITKRYEEIRGPIERSTLQMKLTRAINAHCIWPQSELDLLTEAWRVDDEQRYQRIIQYMEEKGGCKVWPWKPKHVEAQLVRLGLEEPELRNQETTRRKASSARNKNTVQTMALVNRNPAGGGGADVTTWVKVIPAKGAAEHGGSPTPQSAVAASSSKQQDDEFAEASKSSSSAYAPDTTVGQDQQVLERHTFSNQTRDQVFDQIEHKYYPEDAHTATHNNTGGFFDDGEQSSRTENKRQYSNFHGDIAMKVEYQDYRNLSITTDLR